MCPTVAQVIGLDKATSALARMNRALHDCPTAEIWPANSLSSPHFKDERNAPRLKAYGPAGSG